MSPTRVIQSRLEPYFKREIIHDQDRAWILIALDIINTYCPDCPVRKKDHE
jgi:hypothetical protein